MPAGILRLALAAAWTGVVQAAAAPSRPVHAVIVRARGPQGPSTPTACLRLPPTPRGPSQVDASKYFFNYRHASNALAVYSALRRAGVPNQQVRPFRAPSAAHTPLFSPCAAPHGESMPDTPLCRGGIRQIMLMVADDAASDPRNVHRGQLFAEPSRSDNLLRGRRNIAP